jgi:TetR/AcrR family transcriptional repressor of nem operon
MGEGTRERIIKAGAAVMHRKGFLGAGLQEMLEAAGAPRGSFYHYFKSKEDFALAVVDHYQANLTERSRALLEDKGVSPLVRLRNYFERYRANFLETGCTLGCPIGNLSQEMGDLSEPLQGRLDGCMSAMTDIFGKLIAEGQATGEIKAGLDSREAAEFLMAAWQGTLLRMKVAKSPAPIDVFFAFAFDLLAA